MTTVVRTPSIADIIRQAIEDRLADVHTMLPGRIDSYDPTTQKADVEPLIRRLQQTVDGELKEDLPVIPGVPVIFPRTRAYKLTMPVEPGDRCMLVFCESSTETYQVGDGRKGSSALIKQTDPDTFERFNLTDPVCLLGWYNDAEALTSSDQDGMQLGKDGGAIIHIGPDLIELYEKSGVDADFVALAGLVKSQLQAIQAAYDVHTHPTAPTGPVSPPSVIVGTISDVNATKVKAT